MKQTFYPYRLHPLFGIPMGIFAIGACMLCCQLLDSGNRSLAMAYFLFATACLLLGKHLMDTAKYHVDFSGEGITVAQSKKAVPIFVLWPNIRSACYARNKRGQPYLILSPDPLDAAQANMLAQKSALRATLYTDGAVTIFLSQLKNTSVLEALVSQHTPITTFF